MRSSARCSRDCRRGAQTRRTEDGTGGAKEARRDALRGVAGALEEVREDLTVLGAKLEELRLAEGDEAEAGNADETRERDDADVDEK